MSFILSLLNNGGKDEVLRSDLGEIEKLKWELVDIGFAPDEVDYMIKKHTGKKSFTELRNPEINSIKKALSTQLELARKCLDLIKEE